MVLHRRPDQRPRPALPLRPWPFPHLPLLLLLPPSALFSHPTNTRPLEVDEQRTSVVGGRRWRRTLSLLTPCAPLPFPSPIAHSPCGERASVERFGCGVLYPVRGLSSSSPCLRWMRMGIERNRRDRRRRHTFPASLRLRSGECPFPFLSEPSFF
jgi:hypothetical protein